MSDDKISQRAIEAEIETTRAELAATIDSLSLRLDPRIRAAEAKVAAVQAGSDAAAFLKGDGLPAEDPNRARNVKVLLGAAAGVVGLIALKIIRR